jgi:hypothetical protein
VERSPDEIGKMGLLIIDGADEEVYEPKRNGYSAFLGVSLYSDHSNLPRRPLNY